MPLLSVPLQGKRRLTTELCCFLWHTPPALKLKVTYHKEKTCCQTALIPYSLLFFLFVLTPLSRYFIKINLLGLKLQFKGTSSYLQMFVIFMCLAASQTVFTEILCRLFPSADWKRKRDNEGGKEGKLIILGVFWGRLPTFIDLSPFFFTQENKNVE